jgi:hypothetical protein
MLQEETMFSIALFAIAVVCTFATLVYKRERRLPESVEVFLGYVFLFVVGVMSLLAAYAHVFMGPETAHMIGWQSGSPFQFEIGMANLSYGILGVLAFWIRGRFWDACAIGWSVLLLGCFYGHLVQYYQFHNVAPYNIGYPIWFYDLAMPVIVLISLIYVRVRR